MQRQLPLEFKFNNEFTIDSFVSGMNDELLVALKNIRSFEVPIIYFWGLSGVGKTHLLQALCQSEVFAGQPVALIPLNAKDDSDSYAPQILEGLEKMSLVCIDDINTVAGNNDWETAIFHFYNRARDVKMPLVISGDKPPVQLDVSLPDLKTRLGWGLVIQLHGLSDEEKLDALRLRARHRGIELSDDVGEFLLRRYSREMSDLTALLNALDKASLTEQRRLTIPFVKKFMENQQS